MIELKNIIKIYKSKKANDTKALDDISLNFASKGLTFIVGTSGSGKSTLLNIIGSLDSVTSGNIIIAGKDITTLTDEELIRYRNSYLGFIFQDYNLIDEYNVYDNINLALSLQGKNDALKINNLLEDLDIKDLGKRNINELSGGQKQRVAIARALVKDPKLILADEPTGNLDSKTSIQIMEILKRISDDRQVIVVSHDLKLAEKYGDRIIEIEDGKITSDTLSKDIQEKEEVIDYRKSKLSFKETLHLSLLNIRAKMIKSILMILLTSLSLLFIAFIFNIFMFNEKELALDTIFNNDEHIFDIEYKNCVRKGIAYECSNNYLYDDELNDVNNVIDTANIFYELYDNNKRVAFQFGKLYEDSKVENTIIRDERKLRVVEVTDDKLLEGLIGNIPKGNDEIVISKGISDEILKKGVLTSDEKIYKPKSIDELLNSDNYIQLNSKKVKIVGVIDENGDSNDESHYYYDYIYVKGFVNDNEFVNDENILFNFIELSHLENNEIGKNAKFIKDEVRYINNDGIKSTFSLNEDEIIISIDDLSTFYYNTHREFIEFQSTHKDMNYNEVLEEYLKDFLTKFNNIIGKNVLLSSSVELGSDTSSLKIIGVSLDGTTYLSSSLSKVSTLPIKNVLGVKTYIDKKEDVRKLFDRYDFHEFPKKVGDVITISYRHQMQVNNTASFYNDIRLIISIITVIFVIFATILIINYVHSSISYAKKNIGILKSMGTSNRDVMKIFITEFLIIDILSSIFSLCILFMVNRVLNNTIGLAEGYIFNYIIVSPYTVIFIPAFAILFTMMFVIGETMEISNMKPIDAILDK